MDRRSMLLGAAGAMFGAGQVSAQHAGHGSGASLAPAAPAAEPFRFFGAASRIT